MAESFLVCLNPIAWARCLRTVAAWISVVRLGPLTARTMYSTKSSIESRWKTPAILCAKLTVASPVVLNCSQPASSAQNKWPLSESSLEDNIQLREYAVESGACAAGNRQHDPVVPLDPGHPVGICGLCSICLEQRLPLALLVSRRSRLFNDARL